MGLLTGFSIISGVEIVTRYGCCAERVRDIEVRAGMESVPSGFKGRLTTNTKVATFDGPADANLKTYRINFDRSVLAKYVTLQRIGGNVTLEINEVTMIQGMVLGVGKIVRRSSWSTGNKVSGHYKRHYFLSLFIKLHSNLQTQLNFRWLE